MNQAVLEFKSSSERRSNGGTGFGSLLLSLLFHAMLAILLWSLVITVTKPESIFLMGSAARDDVEVAINVATPQQEEEPALDPIDASTTSKNTDAAIDALIAEAMKANVPSSSSAPTDEPRSIEFFGTRAVGNQFVFVLDISYSMEARRGERFKRACDELIRAVSQLEDGQSYYVFGFCWRFTKMFYDRQIKYVSVEAGHEEKLRHWIYDVSLGAGTDPRRALSLASEMNPDAVFLLSDGEFNAPSTPTSDTGWLDEQGERMELSVQEGIEKYYRSIPIHTISFENPFTSSIMEEIARSTGGQFRYIKTRSLEPADSSRFLAALNEIKRKHRQQEDQTREYQTRLSLARDLITEGELLYAEYLIRPLYHADPSAILNPKLLQEILSVLDTEIGKTRLEDFESPPETLSVVTEGTL